jgi:hypothetical protein
MNKKDIDVVETTLFIVEGGCSFATTISAMKTTKLQGLFCKEFEVMQQVLGGCKKTKFDNLEDFLNSCYSDEWEFICLFPDIPVGRVMGDTLSPLNYNTKIGSWSNKIFIKSQKQEYGGTPPFYIALYSEWSGTFHITDYFVLRNRKYQTKEEYLQNH